MITILEMDTFTKKQCVALRLTLMDAYKIIAQGANDIMNVRHDIAEVQDKYRRRKRLLCRKPSGQQLITDWLGQKCKRMVAHADVDTNVQGQEYNDEHKHEHSWIPPLNLRTREDLRQETQKASSQDTIMASQGNTHVRVRQLQCILDGGKLDSDIIGAFCRLLDNGTKRRHCKVFKPGLYYAQSVSGPQGKATKGGKDDAKRFTHGIDVFQYEVILVPIWIDKHWTSIAIDTVKKQI